MTDADATMTVGQLADSLLQRLAPVYDGRDLSTQPYAAMNRCLLSYSRKPDS